MRVVEVAILASFMLVAQAVITAGSADAQALGGHCANWMVSSFTDANGQNRIRETQAACTTFEVSGDFVGRYIPETESCLICSVDDWTPATAATPPPGKTWCHTAGHAIRGNNIRTISPATVDQCKVECENSGRCKSFDFDVTYSQGLCHLSDLDRGEAQSDGYFVADAQWDFYSRTCK